MLHFSTTLLLAAACLLVSSGVCAEKVITCGPHVHRLSCDSGAISVQTALYGRADTNTCSGNKTEEEVANTQCSLQGALDTIKTRCDGKKVCELSSSIFTTDPCSDTFKYLETTYTCVPATHLITCEHSLVHMECADEQVLVIYGADFGRRDPTTCSYKKPASKIENVSCFHPTGLVAERCNGKTSCTMRASSSVFGDSCEDTYKYLEVAYTCQNPVAA
ncbi:L-rhamnose-binding lectin SML-like [Toxotes jaculatrix]|uniref:L-rhamnose-binding lectin SML-like n=1 Tax=Toxotes jaculatrix TaxID=941984 RepID=UPI001B3AB067|nr:L-rhamnose-binding lectin SML-like [Toxotes jaculatrix]